MKKTGSICAVLILMVLVVVTGVAWADEIEAITADEAFDKCVADEATVIVDVRTPEEYYWVGTCGKVDKILTNKGKEISPDDGKVKLLLGGRLLQFKVSGHPKFLPVRKVDKIETSAIAINIPYMLVDYANGCNTEVVDEVDFKDQFQRLIEEEGVSEVILMCRSGKRSTNCASWVLDVFYECNVEGNVYEIDRPDKNGRGGLQGTSYSNNYNGYRGVSRKGDTASGV